MRKNVKGGKKKKAEKAKVQSLKTFKKAYAVKQRKAANELYKKYGL